MGDFLLKILGLMFKQPLGNVILGIITIFAIGMPIYRSQDTWAWVIVGIILAVVGIIRIIINVIAKSSGNNKEIIGNDPTNLDGYNNRGKSYLEKRNYDLAIIDFTKVIDMDVNYVPAYVSRGFAYESKGNFDLAKADYKKALSIDPNYTPAKDNLEKLK